MLIFNLAISALIANSINCINLCGDWTQYKDIKCIKVLQKSATEEEALNNCTQLEQSSTLLTIQNKDDQEFVNSLLANYRNISVNTWIGLKYMAKQYKWLDETKTNYTNWQDNVGDGTDPCVQMSLLKPTLGKWSDVPCNRLGLIVCQKKQDLNLNTLRDVLENITKVMEKQQNITENQKNDFQIQNQKLENKINSLIPLGFLYTQLPNQSSPQQLWPNMEWTEVTEKYAGLFFRAEGGGSEEFGQVQAANYSTISDIKVISVEFQGTNSLRYEQNVHVNENSWTHLNPGWAFEQMYLFTTSAENRPRNTAIKIWKRIQ